MFIALVHYIFREDQGLTVVDIQVVSVSSSSPSIPTNESSVRRIDSLQDALIAAVSDGKVGGYEIDASLSPSLTFNKPFRGTYSS